MTGRRTLLGGAEDAPSRFSKAFRRVEQEGQGQGAASGAGTGVWQDGQLHQEVREDCPEDKDQLS